MESLSRPFHRRKLSNASTFSGKNAYDGVFSGHRPNYGGAPAAKVEDYREIFSGGQSATLIPVLDVSTLEGSSDDSNLEFGRSKPDYRKIFGGFRDEDIAVSYDELLARDKDRVSSSTSSNSQDLDDSSHQSSDALKQFNMSYHKTSQRNKDGLDPTTHVTQLHAVPGFTCFIDETAPTPKKETENKKSPLVNSINPSIDSRNEDLPDKQTSKVAAKSDDRIKNTFEIDPKSNASQVSSPSPLDNHKDYQKRPTTVNPGTSSTHGEFSPTLFDEELDVTSAAAVSAAALKKAIEKAQESIRIAKESVGRKKEGLRSFSSRSFKDSLKVKPRPETPSEDQTRKDSEVGRNHKHGGTGVFQDFLDGEKLFGAKKVLEERHGKIKISESANGKSEIPIESPHEVTDSKIDCDSKEVAGETEAIGVDATVSSKPVEVEDEDEEALSQKPRGFLEIESLERKLGETEERKLVEQLNNLTVYLEQDVKNISEESTNQNGYEKILNEEMGLLENENLDILEQEDVKKVENEADSDNEQELKEDVKEEDPGEKFYDVSEVETNDISQTNASYSLETNDMSPKKDFEVAGLDINEASSSDYDDAEESESACNIVTDTQVEETEAKEADYESEEKEIFEKISLDEHEEKGVGQNDLRSESSSDTTHGMEIEVNEYKERPEIISEKKDEVKENEHHKRVEEREREKNRLAVERAIREARERAFAEARERAERAAVERVNAEVRQRVMADAHEKVSKASFDRASEQAKLRAERAAVERATSEARQRALEKAMSQKNVSDRTSVSKDQSSNGASTESALRSKAKLEKHNRIMERAAKALAEKEKRDLLVQKEQAERSRLAENLDAEIRRWSSGKEGNLRALLSTLQYILGADSGWQAVSLTDIITNSAVKKAYRKATLCVHPDKLQQRGASIQQKYISEKVFDLLKAAWNKFNSEER